MDYFHKIDQLDTKDFIWNIPEQKQGKVNVIGGNVQSFRTPVNVTEYLINNFPTKEVHLVLPDALKPKLPLLDNLIFLSSTDSGSFSDSDELKSVFKNADFNLLIGDLSKNNITEKAISSACNSLNSKDNPAPILLTRDAIDSAISHTPERLLMNDNLIFLATMPQLIKLFRAVYYPKMLIISESLLQVADALHKFTLSYPVSLITLHSGQIIIAKNGTVHTLPLAKTSYSPLNFWFGEPAGRILAFNLYNPNNFALSTVASLISK